MAVVVVTATATVSTTTGATTLTGTLPTGLTNGDVLIAGLVKGNATAFSSSNSYTAFTSSFQGTVAGQDLASELWYKHITDAGSETNPAWTWTTNANAGVVLCRVTGLDTADLEDGTPAVANAENADNPTAVGSITIGEANNLNIAALMMSHGTGGTDATAFTIPSGMTLIKDNYTPNHTQIALCYEIHAAGATGTRTFTTDGTSGRQESHQYNLAFTAAVAGGANPHGPLGHPLHGPFGGPI